MEMQTQIRRRWKRSSHWNLRKKQRGIDRASEPSLSIGKDASSSWLSSIGFSKGAKFFFRKCRYANTFAATVRAPITPTTFVAVTKSSIGAIFFYKQKSLLLSPKNFHSQNKKTDSPLSVSPSLSLLSPQRTTPLLPPPPPPLQFLKPLNILTKIECSSTSEARSLSEGFLLTLVF